VTGAAGLIGSGLVEGFLAGGALVYAVDRDGDRLQKLASRCADQCDRLVTEVADLRDPDAIQALARRVGSLTILINNAGFNDYASGVATPTIDSWRNVLDINLVGPALLTGALLPQLDHAAPRSSVLFVTSTNGLEPSPWLHYGAAKAGVAKLAHDLAAELAPRSIRVNAVAPGWTTLADLEPHARRAPYPLGHTSVPVQAVVHAALFLSDPALSPMTTGQHLAVDGGVLHTQRRR
jgi:NAD(P)-dependent dehydrogenase (short-subunit alcohol dehydrogenase family)